MRGRFPIEFPEWAKGCWGQIGQDHAVHTREAGRAGHTTHTGAREQQGLPMGPCGQNTRRLRKLPRARGGQKSWRPCSLHVPSGTGWERGHALRTLLPVLTEKELALGLLQTAVAQLLPQGLVSIPTEKLLYQLQDVQESLQERQPPNHRWVSPLSRAPRFPELLPRVQHLSFQVRLVGCGEGRPGTGQSRLIACPGGRGQPLPRTVQAGEAHSARPDSAARRGLPEGVTCVSCSKIGLEAPQLALRELFGKTR